MVAGGDLVKNNSTGPETILLNLKPPVQSEIDGRTALIA